MDNATDLFKSFPGLVFEILPEFLYPNVSTPTKIEQHFGELNRSLRNNL
jgi:hypothetical protein